MNIANWKIRLFQIIRLLIVLFSIYITYWLIMVGTPLLYPFLISLLIALIINRPVNWLTKHVRIPRWLSVLLMLLVLLVLTIGIVTMIVTFTVIEIGNLTSMLPQSLADLSSNIQRLISQDFLLGIYNRLEFMYAQLDPNYKTAIDNNIGSAIHTITQAGQSFVLNFLNSLKTLLLSLPNLATVLVISLLGAFFISKDFYAWKGRFQRLMPQGVNSRMDSIVLDLRNALFGFIKAQLTLISLTAAIVIVGLLIMRVEFAITIGLLTGLVDLLPYLGTGTVFIPWIVYAFFKGNYSLVIGLSILYGVVLIFRQIIEPKIVAENVGLDPLLTLVALFIGLHLFGFLGLIIGPVSLVLLNALLKANVHKDLWEYIKGAAV